MSLAGRLSPSNLRRSVSVGPSVVGPFRCHGDQPVPSPLRSSPVPPELGIPDYWLTIGSAHCGSPVSATGVPFVYSGWGPHQGQWSFDPQRSERLTPLSDLRSFPGLFFSFRPLLFHSVSSLGSVRPPGCYLLKLDRAHPWASVNPMTVTSIQTTCRSPGQDSIFSLEPLLSSTLDCIARNILPISTLFSRSASRSRLPISPSASLCSQARESRLPTSGS